MAKENNQRLDSIDILKGFAIITVVIGHSGLGSLTTRYLATFHMQIFFFLSGFFYRPLKYQKMTELVKRKARTLLRPYVFFAALTIAICLCVSLYQHANIYNFPQCLTGVVWSNRAIFPITGGLWFLQCLFWVELIFWVIESYTSSRGLHWFMGVVFLLAFIQSQYQIKLPFSIDSALSAVLFYYFGYCWKCIYEKRKNLVESDFTSALIACCCLILGVGLTFANGVVNQRTCEYGIYPLFYVNAMTTIAGLMIAAGIFAKSQKGFTRPIKAILIRCGKHSIVFMGLNQLVIEGIYRLSNWCFTFETVIQKGIRNIMICFLSCVVLYYLTFVFERTKLGILIGKQV